MNRSTDLSIPFARPSIGPEEIDAVTRVLSGGWLTTAGEAATFEREFSQAVGAPRALAVSSATAGLHLSAEAAEIAEGAKVLMSPYTFTATAEVVRYLGAHPFFVDIDYETLNLDEERALSAIASDPTITAVMPVHIGGLRTTSEGFLRELRDRGVRVVEDAAHCCPSIPLPPREAVGDFLVYSFYATKPITTGEGGMVAAFGDEEAARMATMRLHGIDRPVWDRQKGAAGRWEYDVLAPGYKYNLPDTAAALGRVQLRRAPELRERRRRIAEAYRRHLADRDYLVLPPPREDHSWHLFVVSFDSRLLSIGRDEVAEELAARGIGTSVHYKPLHLMSYYRKSYGFEPTDFPVSLERFMTSLSLPIYPDLTDDEVDRVAESLKAVCDPKRRG